MLNTIKLRNILRNKYIKQDEYKIKIDKTRIKLYIIITFFQF